MSAKQDTSNTMMMCCASCGKAEGDGVQLRTCTACKSVRYCGVTCQKNHRPKHKKACKKRAAELRDEILFQQPESSHEGDCPICLLPIPINEDTSLYHPCCSKVVCNGCLYATYKRSVEQGLETTCPFCRDVIQKSDPEQQLMKRVQANDPVAIREMGMGRYRERNYTEAFQLLTKAAELGDTNAHYQLSIMYEDGEGVEKDEKKCVYHAEEASIGGHPASRLILADYEIRKADRIDRMLNDRAKKHLIIGANFGNDGSIRMLEKFYSHGLLSKEDFEAAVCAHKAAVDATRSPQRDKADAVSRKLTK